MHLCRDWLFVRGFMMFANVSKRIVNLYCLFGKMADMKVSERQMLNLSLNVSLNCKP